MFGHQAPARRRAVPGSRRADDETAAHLARRRAWIDDSRRLKAKAVIAGCSPEAVGLIRRPIVSVLVATARPERLEHVYKTVARQQDVQVQLVLLTLGFCPGDAVLRRLAGESGIDDVVYLYLPDDIPLGECYNYGVRSADGDVVAIMDDGDHYGPNYLSDQLYSLEYSGADLVCKQAYCLYLEELETTLLRFDERERGFTDSVNVSTVLGARDVLVANPFPPFGIHEDGMAWSPEAKDLRVYSSDKFNYFRTRLAVGSSRGMPESKLLSSGRFQFFGDPEPRIDI